MCQDCRSNSKTTSSFLFGIVLGLILGAFIAYVFYHRDKDKILLTLKSKLNQLLAKYLPDSVKVSPQKSRKPTSKKRRPSTPAKKPTSVASSTLTTVATHSVSRPKMFVKAKR